MRTLITGATGFIGGRLAAALTDRDRSPRLLTRRGNAAPPWYSGELTDPESLTAACTGMHRVFHCAGYAHAFSALSDAHLHRTVNFKGTRNLAEAAGQAGVRNFVFLSSVKAMAEPGSLCANEDFPGEPATAYGRAKRDAEEAILDAGRRYGMRVVNLRLAMVYGAGGKGNLDRMARMIRRGMFPPLPETGNHRSMIHVDDVVAAMLLAAEDERAQGTYIITGPDAPSGRQLYDALREALGQPPRSWAIPAWALQTAARLGDRLERLCGRRLPLDSEALDRLLGSAWYSSEKIEKELGWQASVGLRQGLAEMLRP